MNDMTREERLKGAVEKYLTNQAKQGKRGRKWKAVKLFSVERYKPRRRDGRSRGRMRRGCSDEI